MLAKSRTAHKSKKKGRKLRDLPLAPPEVPQTLPPSSDHRSTARYELYNKYDQSHDEKQMDKAANRRPAKTKAKRPHYQQDQNNRPKHRPFPLFAPISRAYMLD
jgi:hypothetical protein